LQSSTSFEAIESTANFTNASATRGSLALPWPLAFLRCSVPEYREWRPILDDEDRAPPAEARNARETVRPPAGEVRDFRELRCGV